MHTDLSPHLHTEECNQLIQKFLECDKYYTFQRYFGKCTIPYKEMTRCTKKERIKKREENHNKAKERQAEVLKRMRESEKNSS